MIVILGAMDIEITAFLENIAEPKKHHILRDLTIHEGKLGDAQVAIAKTGVGKTMTAISCQCIIDFLKHSGHAPEYILFTGIAGAINPHMRIGDTLVAADCIQHDLDTTALGIPRGTVPDTEYRFLKADAALFEIAMSYEPEEGHVHSGRILTGDQFIDNYHSDQYSYMINELTGDGVEMEGASAALCAAVNGIPFLIIRTISDNANQKAPMNFREFVPKASYNNFKAVQHIIQRLNILP